MKSLILISFVLCAVYLPQALGKNYYIIEEGATWYAALQNCHAEGLRLATVRSENERNDMENIIKEKGDLESIFWLAGSDLAEEGTFVWWPSFQPLDFTYWGSNEPSNNVGENCLCRYGERGWYAASCSGISRYICED